MSSRQQEIEASGSRQTNATSKPRPWLGLVCALGISLSMVVPEGFSIAPVILMAFGAWSLIKARWHREDTNFAITALLICFAVYAAGSAALSAVHGDHPGHFEQYLPFLGAALMAVALQTTSLNVNQLIGGFAVAAVLAGTASIVQVLQAEGAHRATLLTTTNTFGALGVLYGVISASALGWSDNQICRRLRVLLVFGAMGGLTVSLLSGSKGSWLALLAVGPLAFVHATKTLTLPGRIKWALAVLVYGFLITTLPHSQVVSRAQGFTQHGDSFRVAYWKQGLEIIKTNPLLGVGRREVSRQLVELTTRRHGSPLPTEATRELHNEYLDILAARGVLGLALVLTALIVPLVLLARSARAHADSNRDPAITGLLFIAAFAICGLTDVQFQITAKRMTYVLCVVMFVHFASGKPCRDP